MSIDKLRLKMAKQTGMVLLNAAQKAATSAAY